MDAVTAQLDILPQHILGVNEENNNFQSEQLVSGPKSETNLPNMQNIYYPFNCNIQIQESNICMYLPTFS